MKIYYEVVPKHYVGGIAITIRFPEGSLGQLEKSIIEEKLAQAYAEINALFIEA